MLHRLVSSNPEGALCGEQLCTIQCGLYKVYEVSGTDYLAGGGVNQNKEKEEGSALSLSFFGTNLIMSVAEYDLLSSAEEHDSGIRENNLEQKQLKVKIV